jgi:cyanate permease
MEQSGFKVYGYRWVVLLAFMFVVIANQLSWITFAPITNTAAKFYGVSEMSIGLLSMSFMIVYILVSIPASWVIDTYGMRVAVGFGALLMAIFGLMRGLAASTYTMVLIAQIGIAVGQPFILNSVTKVAARWFPFQERATASGLGTMSIYVGIIIGMVATPFLTLEIGLERTLLVYGIFATVVAVAFIILAKERPPTPPGPPGQEERALMLDGLKLALKTKDFLILLVVFFVGLGVFNGVTTWIEELVRPRGFSIAQAGVAGGAMVFFGVLGAAIVPVLSDRYRKRVPFIATALAVASAGLVGMTFARSYWLLLLSAAILGFFMLSAAPIGFQYGAEVTYPAPEGTTNGLLLMAGQVSGILFIFGMDAFKSPQTGSMTPSMLVLIGLTVLAVLLCALLKEPRRLSRIQ